MNATLKVDIPEDVRGRYLHGRINKEELKEQPRRFIEDYALRYCISDDLPDEEIIDRIFSNGVEYIPILPNHTWAFFDDATRLLVRKEIPKPQQFLKSSTTQPDFPFPPERFPDLPRDTYSPEPPDFSTSDKPAPANAESQSFQPTQPSPSSKDGTGNQSRGKGNSGVEEHKASNWLEDQLKDFEVQRQVVSDKVGNMIEEAKSLGFEMLELMGMIDEERADTRRLLNAVHTVCGDELFERITKDVRKTLSFDINSRRNTKGPVSWVLHAPAEGEEVDPNAGTIRKSRFERHREIFGASGRLGKLWTDNDPQVQKTLLENPAETPETAPASTVPVISGTSTKDSVTELPSESSTSAVATESHKSPKRPREDEDTGDSQRESVNAVSSHVQPPSPKKRAKHDPSQENDGLAQSTSPLFSASAPRLALREAEPDDQASAGPSSQPLTRSSSQYAGRSKKSAQPQNGSSKGNINYVLSNQGSEPEVLDMLLPGEMDQESDKDVQESTRDKPQTSDEGAVGGSSTWGSDNIFLQPSGLRAGARIPSPDLFSSFTYAFNPGCLVSLSQPTSSGSPQPQSPPRKPKPLTRSYTRVHQNPVTGEFEEYDYRDTRTYQELEDFAWEAIYDSQMATLAIARREAEEAAAAAAASSSQTTTSSSSSSSSSSFSSSNSDSP